MRHLNFSTFIILLLFICSPVLIIAQNAKKGMSVDDLVAWKRITSPLISDDGKWVACKMEPWRGDAEAKVYNSKGKETASFMYVDKMEFTASSGYLLITQKTPLDTLEFLKLKKTKAENMPMDQLVIYQPANNQQAGIDSIKSYKLSKSADWIAYQQGNNADSALYVCALNDITPVSFPAVTDFQFAKDKNILYYVSKGDTIQTKAGLYTYLPAENKSQLIHEGKGVFKQMVFDKKGDKLAFLYCPDKDSTATGFSLFVSVHNAPANLIADRDHTIFPENWIISEHGTLSFSEDAERLFFGIAPLPKQRDTTILAENRPDVEVWKWDEKTQYTQQKYNKEKDLKKTYTAVYNISNNRVVQLTDPETPLLQTADKGNSTIGIVSTSQPYDLERMWEGRTRFDFYTVNLDNGETQPVKKALPANMRLSPKGKYAYWYCPEDSSWYTWSIADKKEYRLTTPASFIAWDEDNDVPDYPSPYGIAGWSVDDKYVLIYDRYDIWKFDPANAGKAENLTINGRNKSIVYRYIRLDKEEQFIDFSTSLMLTGFNEQTKGYGYYRLPMGVGVIEPKALLIGDFMLKNLIKAKYSYMYIYTTERYDQYPDLQMTDFGFEKSIKLTDGIKQQVDFRWGKAELISWTSLDGKKIEGVVYKPADFDPKKKYPLIVNFYERNSETLHNYHMPEPHRSTIDYHFYNSNGYIVFNPDVIYEDGYPGESCYNCVMPGIASLIEKGYINEKAIGAQGHSWGGYQVAYLTTRTNLFAAIESGAPVVNMFSAYGGIRWGSGLNRSFQYEHSQSRIGATIWEKPLRYIENSPLFTMDKVQTPILIMHNDQDGHVPWYQGIEYFIALKRLQKPVWLLNYPGEIHWPQRLANKVDFQKRMFQFFEYYLNRQPMPKWMEEGIPAVDKEFELGY
ncbi:MAG: prolyl oligopeptidase family serine peptidase [Tannerella sp.]|jgi:dipeptidyl aminopeptidase/acylaminoacyl peptidase|nr:prolyl oligopeptidase family serine peptidase [Tannerella sp.]